MGSSKTGFLLFLVLEPTPHGEMAVLLQIGRVLQKRWTDGMADKLLSNSRWETL